MGPVGTTRKRIFKLLIRDSHIDVRSENICNFLFTIHVEINKFFTFVDFKAES